MIPGWWRGYAKIVRPKTNPVRPHAMPRLLWTQVSPPKPKPKSTPPTRPQRHYTCNHDPLLPPKGKEMRKYLVVDLVVALGTGSGLTVMVENAGAGVI